MEELQNEPYVHFRMDTPALLSEILHCVIENPKAGCDVLSKPMMIFKNYLIQVAQRAIELDDPKLNILMLEMKLYDVEHDKIFDAIKQQEKRLSKNS